MKPRIRQCRLDWQRMSAINFFGGVAASFVRYSCEGMGVVQYGATAKDAYRHWFRDAFPLHQRLLMWFKKHVEAA